MPRRSIRWLPVIFTIGTLVLVGDVGDAAELIRRGHAAVDPRNHRERAVLLDVGVDAIVDEPRRAILVVVAAPEHVEHVAERRLADLAADAVAVDLEHLLHRLQPLAAQDVAQLVFGKRQAAADDGLALVFELGRDGAQQFLAQRSCSCRSSCSRACTP